MTVNDAVTHMWRCLYINRLLQHLKLIKLGNNLSLCCWLNHANIIKVSLQWIKPTLVKVASDAVKNILYHFIGCPRFVSCFHPLPRLLELPLHLSAFHQTANHLLHANQYLAAFQWLTAFQCLTPYGRLTAFRCLTAFRRLPRNGCLPAYGHLP